MPQHTHYSRLCASVILLLSLVPVSSNASRQSETRLLAVGVPETRDIKGPDAHLFEVSMEAGQYARIKIRRSGIDLIVTVTSPNGDATVHEDAAGPESPMTVSIISNTNARYTLKVQPAMKWAAAGGYQIELEAPHNVGPQDAKRLDAEMKMAAGRSKQFIDTDESRLGAIASYREALTLWQELGDTKEEANTLQFIAQTYFALGDFDKCIDNYSKALNLRTDEDKQVKAYTVLELAGAYLENSRHLPDALSHYNQAYEVFTAMNNRRGQADALYGLGLTKARMSEMSEAVTYYKRALVIYTDPATRNRHEEARTSHALAGALDVMGEPDQAGQLFESALEGWRETGDLGQEGNTYSSLAKREMDRGNWQLAFDTYEKALDLYKRAEVGQVRDVSAIRRRRSSTLYNLSYTYAALNDYAKAQEYLDQSLALRKPGAKGSTLMLKCYFHALAGETARAFEFCNQALAEQEASGDRRISETYTAMGVANAVDNKHAQALELFDKALAIQTNEKTRSPQAEAITQGWRGESLAALGSYEKALASYARSRDLWLKYSELNGVALALVGMARCERALNNPKLALEHVTEAIAAIEPLRSNVTSEALRSSYFSTKVDYYELYIDLSLQLAANGDTAKPTEAAFEASERARARSFIETLAQARIEGEVKLDHGLANLVSKYRRVQSQIQAAKLEGYKGAKEDQTAADSRLETERAGIESQLQTQYPRYAALMYPRPLTVSQVQKLLDEDTLLLEFTLGQERSYVLAMTATELHSYELPPRARIEESAQSFLKHLKAGQPVFGESAAKRKARMDLMANYRSEATALSRMLLGKVSSLSKKKNLLIVADGQLQYIPFAALPSPDATPGVGSAGAPLQATLVQDHEITNLPSASVLGVLRESPHRELPSKSVAIFADPVLEKDDPRIQLAQHNRAKPVAENQKYLQQALRDIADDGETAKLGRLGASGREARQIIALTPPGSSFEALGFKANRENATSKQLRLYWAVHFATHGILNETNPGRSGVVLSLYDEQGRFHEEGFLRLEDIYDLNLPVDLVVLSACRTGLGKPVKGEGLIGLTRGFMHAGTRRVLASLWKVDDDATAELMKRFYQNILKEGMTPAAALRAAQSSMAGETRWSHPYYWAGFVLQGEPK